MSKKLAFLVITTLIFALVIFTHSAALTQVDSELKFEVKDNWQYAAKVAPSGLMQQVANENLKGDWLGDPNRMQVIKIQLPKQVSPLYLINSRVQYQCPPIGCDPSLDPLCGSAGCAYFGYVQSKKSYHRVFAQYLKSSLPPGVNFLRVSNQLVKGFPCLEFREMPKLTTNKIRVSQYCFNGQQYSLEHQFSEPPLSN